MPVYWKKNTYKSFWFKDGNFRSLGSPYNGWNRKQDMVVQLTLNAILKTKLGGHASKKENKYKENTWRHVIYAANKGVKSMMI